MIKYRAFTLIELLVVMAIICILAALALPTFRTVQETSRTSKCSDNLRQIGAGMFLFSADHENKFPESGEQSVTWGATDSSTGEPSWMQQLGPYVGNPSNPTLGTIPSVFTCPSSGQTKIGEKYYSYFNGCHAAWAQLTSAGEPAKPAAIRRTLVIMPAEQILSGDITNTTWDTSGGKLDADKNDYTVNPIQTQSTYHNGSINLLFADGHVEVEKWNTNLSPPGYFDQTRMCTHYQGTVNGGQPYLTP